MSAINLYKKIIWRTGASTALALEGFATWSLAAVAAVIALTITYIGNQTALLQTNAMRTTLWLLALSIIFGYVSKFLGFAAMQSMERVKELEALFNSQQGQALLGQLQENLDELVKQLSEPFLWPWSVIVPRSARKGASDPLYADKLFVRLHCLQMLALAVHALLAASSVIALAYAIV